MIEGTLTANEAGSPDRAVGLARISLILVVVAVGAFYVMTIRDGHEWGDDFSLYILHAKNLAEGVSYGQTGYIYNPSLGWLGPQTYPPVFPLLLSPVYKLLGLNLTAMKVEVIVVFLLSLIAIFAALRSELPWPYLTAMIAAIGFNPFFWQFKDNIVSDLPFLLFVYLGLFLIHSRYQVEGIGRSQNLRALLTGLVIYFAYGTRSIGIVLLPSLVAYDLIKNRRLTAFVVKVTVITVALVALQSIFLHSDRSYADHIGFSLGAAVRNVLDLAREFSAVIAPSSHKALRFALFAAITGLAIIGCFAKIKDRITVFEVFLVLYLIPLIVLPIEMNVRFLAPVMPLYLVYAFLGIQTIFRGRKRGAVAMLFLLAVIFASYASCFAGLDYGPIHDGIAKKETQEFFDYVKKETGRDDILVFRKPRALALFTGRRASSWHQPADDQALWSYFRQIRATYLVLGPKHVEAADQEYFGNFIARRQDQLQETYSNADFHVYRIKERKD